MNPIRRTPFRTPFQTLLFAAVFAWLLPLGAWLFVQNENGYFSTPADELKADRDQGFRLESNGEKGRMTKECRGVSDGWLGPCGRVTGRIFDDLFLREYLAGGQQFFNVKLFNSRWIWVSATWAHWDDIEIIGSKIDEVDLSFSKLNKLRVSDTRWRGGHFDSAEITDSTFSGMYMEDVSFKGAHFKKVRFQGLACIRCDFRDAKFENSKLEGNFFNSFFNENSVLPFPVEEIGQRNFRYMP